jgi:2-polyprenyl-6-methoxyphenol hydroxylase-like FAD-dependent oxidoreductase
MTEIVDVIQVGYGPVGQVLASLLGSSGISVMVVEKHVDLYTVSRAGTLDHEAMRILQRVGIAHELEPKLSPTLGMELVDADGQLVSKVPVTRGSVSGWHGAYQLYQPDMEDALDRAARSTPGVTVITGWEVIRVQQHPDYVEVESRERTSGDTRVDRGRYLIGADGANSTVREAMELSMTDFGYVGPWLVCDYELADPNMSLPFYASFVVDPARPLLAGRWLGRRHARMEFMVLPDEDPERFNSEEVCWELSRPYGLVPETSRLVRHAVYQFRSLLAENWRKGRVILVGDAAHVMPPFMGQGMCSGFRDAASLAWRLELVLANRADPSLLDSYTEERRAHVEQVIRMSMGLGWLVSITDPDDAAERDADLRELGLPPTPPFPGLTNGIFLPASDGSLTPGAGELGLQSRVERDGKLGLLDDIVGTGWKIISRELIDRDALTAAQRELLDLLECEIVTTAPSAGSAELVDVEMDYEAWFESLGANAVIVRPDFYVFGAVTSARDLGAILDELRRQLVLTT